MVNLGSERVTTRPKSVAVAAVPLGPNRLVGGAEGGVIENLLKSDVLVAVAGVGPGGVGRAVGHRQADAITHIVIGLPGGVGEGTEVGIEGLAGDAEIRAEGLTTVRADGAIDIQEGVGRVAARVVPNDADVSLGVYRRAGALPDRRSRRPGPP